MDATEGEIVEVAVAAALPMSLVYKVPDRLRGLAEPGRRVLVPLGRRAATGWVLGPGTAGEGVRLRAIADVLDPAPLFPASMTPFFRWVADYYLYPIGLAIRDALPAGADAGAVLAASLTDAGRAALAGEGGEAEPAGAGRDVLSRLLDGGPVPLPDLVGEDRARRVLTFRLAGEGLLALTPEALGANFGPRSETWVLGLAQKSSAPPRQSGRHRALSALAARGAMPLRDLKAAVPAVSRHIKAMEEAGRKVIADGSAIARAAGIEFDTKSIVIDALDQHIYNAIDDEAKGWPADLIVIGTHGRRGFKRLFLGSIAEGLTRIASKPVLLIRGG